PGGATAAHEAVGWRPTAIPIVNFSSDDGTGYGLRCSLYEYDGHSIPYVRQYSAQAFATTRGKWVHRLLVDWPEVRPGHRVEGELLYEKEDFANYYGGLPDARVEAYSRDQKTFHQASPQLRVLWISRLRGPWQRRLGARLSHTTIEANADSGSLLRDLDPPGRTGGPFAQVEAALRRDTRDDYNDPAAGRLTELTLQYGVGSIGLPGGLTLSLDQQAFRPLSQGLSLALRLRGDAVLGDVPFYEEMEMGGSSTVRGQAASRDRGKGRLLANAEARWRGLALWRQQQIYLGGAAFADVGQIFALGDGPSSSAWRHGLGLGLRLHWQSTIVRADHGWSGGRTGLYITFSQVF
ncbi:MAG: BamA/TamA family outer membrane protein, partial [Gemmatimonadota bacterium]